MSKQIKNTTDVSTDRVLTSDGRYVAHPEKARRAKTLKKLEHSLYNNEPLTGKITGMEAMNDGSLVAVVYVDDFKILIPFDACVDIPDVFKDDSAPLEKRQASLLQKRLGSEIDFIIRGINEEFMAAAADRKAAMEQKQEMLEAKDENGDYAVQEGALVEARIVSVSRPGITVEMFGVETFIPARDLSYQRIQDCSTRWLTGDTIVCRILSIIRSDAPQISASVKEAMENPYVRAMERYIPGNKYIGTVNLIDKAGVFVGLDGGVDALCPPLMRGTRPMRGTEVTIRITTVNKEQNRIFGLITHVARVGE